MNMKNKILVFGGIIILLGALWTYTQATGDEITVCVNKNGVIEKVIATLNSDKQMDKLFAKYIATGDPDTGEITDLWWDESN